MELLIMQFSLASSYLILLSSLFTDTLNAPPLKLETKFHTHKMTGKIIALYILICRRREDKIF
jgi:hypothetical protein